MKKTLLSISALFAFAYASAQEEPATSGFKSGDVFASGTLSYSTQKTGDTKTNQFAVSPSFGYFVNDNIAVGVMIGYTSRDYKPTDEKYTTLTTGLFGRYYFNPANKFTIYGQLQAGYVSSKSKTNFGDGTVEFKDNGFAASVGPGFNYWLSNHLALESNFGIIGYSSTKPDDNGGNPQSTDTFTIGLDFANINFGVVYKF
jgi:outer membrane protein W